MADKWLTIPQASEYLNISRATLFRWMKNGKLTYSKFGNSTRFKVEDLDQVAETFGETRDPEEVQTQCPICGHKELLHGALTSTGKVYFKPAKAKFLVLRESLIPLKATACAACGHISLFTDAMTLEKLNKEKSQ